MYTFLKRFHSLTESKFELRIKWQTKEVKTLFKVKDPNSILPVSFMKESVLAAKIHRRNRKKRSHPMGRT